MSNPISDTNIPVRSRTAISLGTLPTRIGVRLFGLVLSSLVATTSASAATIVVDSTEDWDGGCDTPNTCTLRGAINKAAAGDTIVFDLPANSTITLPFNALIVGKNLSIDGSAVPGLTISGSNRSRVFMIWPGAIVTLRRLAVTNGTVVSYGGGIVNSGTLTLSDCTVTDNTAGLRGGGGIDNEGTLTLINSTVGSNSSSDAYGGGINNSGTLILNGSTVTGNLGSGISNSGDATVTDSAISFNANGGIVNSGRLTMTRSTVLNNTGSGILTSSIAKITGGAISGSTQNGIYNTGTLTLTDNTVSNNTLKGISSQYGTVALIGSTVSGNAEGGIYNGSGTLTLINSVVSRNTTKRIGGGGIDSYGTLTLIGSTVSANIAADSGGGILGGGELILANSLVSDNTAGYAGGIENNGILTLIDSTISGNTANRGGCGGIRSSNRFGTAAILMTRSTISDNTSSVGGAGICNTYGALALINSTVVGNDASAGNGGGIRNYAADGDESSLTLINSTIAHNSAGGIDSDIYNDIYNDGGSAVASVVNTIIRKCEASGSNATPFIDNGGNLDGGTECGFSDASSKSNAMLDLGALADNGGPTWTMMPGANSDAIGRGLPSACRNAPVNDRDQRGYVRPVVGCTSGAVDPNGSANDSIFFDNFGS